MGAAGIRVSTFSVWKFQVFGTASHSTRWRIFGRFLGWVSMELLVGTAYIV
jgi:hypothetical protein